VWIERFLSELEKRGSVTTAATAARVSRQTVYRERKRNSDFDRAIIEVGEFRGEEVEGALYERAVSGKSIAATILFLRCRLPEVYGHKSRAHYIKEIREEARRELLEKLRVEARQLPREAREALLTAMSRLPDWPPNSSSRATSDTRSKVSRHV
jgi:hypothetical protein